jgi:hypothetical protein
MPFSNGRVEFKRPFETWSSLKQGGFVIFFGEPPRFRPHRIYWGWFGVNQLTQNAVRKAARPA